MILDTIGLNSMRHKWFLLTTVVIIGSGALSGCTTEIGDTRIAPSITDTDTYPSLSTERVITSTPPHPTSTVTPVPSATSTRTFALPTPLPVEMNAHDFDLANHLFSEGVVPNCKMPCWRGLVIGKSGIDDVKYVFDNTYGIKGANNVGLGVLTLHNATVDPNGTIYQWISEPRGIGLLDIGAGSADQDTLQILSFHWLTMDSSKLAFGLSQVDVVRKLGIPSDYLASIELQGGVGFGTVTFLMIYNQGMVFEFERQMPTQIIFKDTAHTAIESVSINFCLGDTEAIPGETLSTGSAYIVPPFLDGLDDMRPVQKDILDKRFARYNFKPIQEVFDVTPEQLVQLVSEQQSPCIRSKVLFKQ